MENLLTKTGVISKRRRGREAGREGVNEKESGRHEERRQVVNVDKNKNGETGAKRAGEEDMATDTKQIDVYYSQELRDAGSEAKWTQEKTREIKVKRSRRSKVEEDTERDQNESWGGKNVKTTEKKWRPGQKRRGEETVK
ncbi:hypothetical protein Pcinc_040177 [Petrolisthes cinctipes]|uniref:Uncharacterized protein n=1 Tax=Petrolisthes cinctipes TaxID=88211 RepID=A0AAE1EIA0_PETCI|nr:hypothetical protein Pcinc_040177 [Petrolisthes cinctipes]